MLKKLLSGILCVGMLMGAAVMPASAEQIKIPIPGWLSSFCEIPEGVEQGDLGVEIITDPEFVQSGEKALHVFGKQDLEYYNVQAVQNIAALEQGKTYRLTGKFWVSRNTWRVRLMFGGTSLEQLGNIVEELNTWCDVDYTIEYNFSSKDFKIQVAGNGEVYADNLSLKEVLYDTDGETVIGYGEELLQNGDFEEDFPQPAEADFVNVAARNGANFIAVKTTAPGTAIYAVGSDGSCRRWSWNRYSAIQRII